MHPRVWTGSNLWRGGGGEWSHTSVEWRKECVIGRKAIMDFKVSKGKEWQSTPVFLPGKSNGGGSPVGYSPGGCKVRHDWATNTFTHFKGTTGHLAKDPRVLTRPCSGRARGMFLLRPVGFNSWILPSLSSGVSTWGSEPGSLGPNSLQVCEWGKGVFGFHYSAPYLPLALCLPAPKPPSPACWLQSSLLSESPPVSEEGPEVILCDSGAWPEQ